MSKKLQNKIAKKLDQLSKLLDQIGEANFIDSDDPPTWDPDTLYNLAENLKEALQLLEDKKSKQLDEFGEPRSLETGLLSLLDDWETEQEETEDYD